MKRILALLTATLCITPTLHAQEDQLFTLQDIIFDEIVTPRYVAVSPDSAHTYILGDGVIVVSTRDSITGELTPVQALAEGVDGIEGIEFPKHLAFSADGAHVYVATDGDSSVVVFERDANAGTLTLVQVLRNNEDGITQMFEPVHISVTPDGNSVYVMSDRDDAIVAFSRDTSTGMLTFLELQENGVNGVDNIERPLASVISPDSKQLYVLGLIDDALVRFDRDVGTGALTYVGALISGMDGVSGFPLPIDLAMSTDGASIYVAGRSFPNGSIAIFDRDNSTGDVTFQDVVIDGVDGVDGLEDIIALAVSADGKSLYTVNDEFNTEGIAQFSRDTGTGALTFVAEFEDSSLFNLVKSVAIAPDGNHVYIAAQSGLAMGIFARNSTTSELSFLESFSSGTNEVDGLDDVQTMVISPDGLHAYVGARQGRSIVTFARDRGTGDWTFASILYDNENGVNGLNNVLRVTISPDGAHVYTVSSQERGIATFSRNTTTGELTFVEFVDEGDLGISFGLAGLSDIIISPDGNHAYVVGGSDSSLNVLSRAIGTGELSFVETETDDVNGVDGMRGIQQIAITPDGKFLYAAATADDAITIFSRNAVNGELTYVGATFNLIDGVMGIDGVPQVEVSPDGAQLYAIGPNDDALVVFTRDTMTGALTFFEMKQDGVDDVEELRGPSTLALSPDGGHVFVGGGNFGAFSGTENFTIFARDLGDGSLTFAETNLGGPGTPEEDRIVRGINSIADIQISPDSSYAHLAAFSDNAVSIWEKGVADFLRGTVTELESGNPVTCGVIEIANGDRSIVETAVTDANGFYFFTNIPYTSYSARVVSPGLGEVIEPSITVVAGAVTEVDIQLPAAESTLNITGTVTDAQTMVPLVGVLVEARIANVLVATTYTCATGVYGLDLPGLKGDNVNVELTFTLDNYDPIIVNESVDLLVLSVVDIAMSKSVGFPSSLTGTVLDDEGEALGGATVTIRGPVNANATTDGAGGYAFDCTDGTYTIRASKAGYEGETGTRSITGGGVAVKTFMLEETGFVLTDPEDINRDMSVNSVDIQIVINKVLGVPTMLNTDVDNSGTTNSVDIQLVINKVLGVK